MMQAKQAAAAKDEKRPDMASPNGVDSLDLVHSNQYSVQACALECDVARYSDASRPTFFRCLKG